MNDRRALPPLAFVTVHEAPLDDGIEAEAGWMAGVAEHGRPVAHLWHGVRSLVVPRRYEREPGFAAARARWAAEGVPVHVRSSGGGLVPQGTGLWNLSLAWRAEEAEPAQADAVYQAMCGRLAAAFLRLGVEATAQPVQGSFCDGRYNLAVGGRKLVGTAQSWRRLAGVPVVLAHAVIVVDADPQAITAEANAFEAAIGTSTRYRAEVLTSVAEAARAAGSALDDVGLAARCRQVVCEQWAEGAAPAGAGPA